MNIGVLALQGDVPEHRRAIRRAAPKDQVTLVRSVADLRAIDVLIMPGGESTTIADLLRRTGLWEPLRQRLESGLPTLATCAGLILLAKDLEPSPSGRDPPTFGILDVTVRRNDYGRQIDSFEGPVTIDGIRGGPFPGVFIRAPRLTRVGTGLRPIAWSGERVVGVRVGNMFGLSFHPELSGDTRLLELFLSEAAPDHRIPRKKSQRSTNPVRASPTTA